MRGLLGAFPSGAASPATTSPCAANEPTTSTDATVTQRSASPPATPIITSYAASLSVGSSVAVKTEISLATRGRGLRFFTI